MKKVNNKEYEDIIFENTKTLIKERGIKGWNMDELAKRSGVAKKTLYSIIGKKEILFKNLFQREMRENFDFLNSILDNTPDSVEALKLINDEMPKRLGGFSRRFSNELSLEYPKLSAELRKHDSEYLNEMNKFFAHCQEHGIIRKDVDIKFYMHVAGIIIEHFLKSDLSEEDFQNYSKQAMKFLLAGIAKEKEGLI